MTTKKLKLRPSVKKKWLAALRSGEYKQTTGALRDEARPDSFCCLGVLCNIHAQEHPKFAKEQTDITTYDGESGVLTPRVLKWAFGASYEPEMSFCVDVKGPENRPKTTLTKLNDLEHYSFDRIADVIEEQL